MVPFLEKPALEALAEETLQAIDYTIGPVSLEAICDREAQRTGLVVQREVPPPSAGANNPPLGCIQFDPLRIDIFENAKPHLGRDRFTLAHELGHHLLQHGEFMYREVCDEGDFGTRRQGLEDDSDIARLEFQANYLASSILLPRANFVGDFWKLIAALDIRDRGYGALFVDTQQCNLDNYHTITGSTQNSLPSLTSIGTDSAGRPRAVARRADTAGLLSATLGLFRFNHRGRMRKKLSTLSLALIVAVFIVFGVYACLVMLRIGPFGTAQDGGQFGDAFGALTSLFNGLAFAGLIITVLLQREDLKLQREELILQRRELSDTREVLIDQRKQLAAQADAAQKQVFEATFFRLLESLRQLVEQTPLGDHRGAMSMHLLAVSLRDVEGGALKRDELNPITASPFFTHWYSTWRPQLAPYFDLLGMTLEFVVKSDRPDKIFYVDILRAALSPGELFLLFHFASARSVQGERRLKELCEQYGLLGTRSRDVRSAWSPTRMV